MKKLLWYLSDLVGLVKELNRSQSSIRYRIKKLKLTGERRAKTKMFTLEEDMVIMDAAMEQNKEVKSLKDTTFSPASLESLSQYLKRDGRSVFKRW